MPNNVQCEIVFSSISEEQKNNIISKISEDGKNIDFGILLPIPLNLWWGNVGGIHEKTFPGTALGWRTKNWGTKWNAYQCNIISSEAGILTLQFQTAWTPPYGWIVAVFNFFEIPFSMLWLSEGGSRSRFDEFEKSDSLSGEEWRSSDATGEQQKHIHKLLWGVEKFEDEEEE